MSRRLIVRAEAEADIIKAALWYDVQKTGLGWQFTVEIRSAIGQAVERPFSHLRLRVSPDVRRILARRFPFGIFYIVRPDAIVVFAVIHTARHERAWAKRL